MSDPIESVLNEFSFDHRHMSGRAVNAVRTVLGIGGVAAVVLGVVLLIWPVKTIAVLAVFLGIYFGVSGVLRIGMGVFSRGMRAGARAVNLILGVLLVLVAVVALKNVATASVALLIFAVAFIGVGWIIEGVLALAESGRSASSGWSIAFGILSILSGIIVLVLPVSSAVVLLTFAAVALVVLGVLGVVRAFTFGRDRRKGQQADDATTEPAPAETSTVG